MSKNWLENIIAGSYALALHIVVVLLLFVGFGGEAEVIRPVQHDIVQATVIDEQTFVAEQEAKQQRIEQAKAEEAARLAEIEKQKAEEQAAKEREAERLRQEEIARQKKIEQEKQRLAELEQKRKAEEARQKAEAEKQRLAEEKRIAEQKKAEEERQKKLEQERLRKEAEAKRLAEEKRKKEEEAKRLAEQKKREAEAEKKRIAAEEKRRREEAERHFQETMAAEALAEEQARVDGVVNQHILMLTQRVKRNWSEPAIAKRGMQCTLRVTLLPNGDVRDVKVSKSSGNAIFDRSAVTAVYKAAPWPQPADPKAAAKLRDFTFVFRPK